MSNKKINHLEAKCITFLSNNKLTITGEVCLFQPDIFFYIKLLSQELFDLRRNDLVVCFTRQ